ncbi:MAG: hypothetical protein A2W80_14410 [Candidatus Riflebacteria bacterium GWC2_50_8]|nr:MAG: hypothetical protein A2W80_14410 [Candidatus Riflebacteria bacterium GWC2_50_8]
MEKEFTVIIKNEGEWWIGWVEEIPGVNCQERTKPELLISLKEALKEALEFNRRDAIHAAGEEFFEEKIAI